MDTDVKNKWKLVQKHLALTPDGIPGIKTVNSVIDRLGIVLSPVSIHEGTAKWPTQSEIRSGRSIFGKAGDESNLVMINFPYLMLYEGSAVTRTRCHKLVAESIVRILKKTLDHYGLDEIRRLRLDQYGGCFNYRKTVSGQSASMHAWGIAVDIDPEHNAYSCKSPHAGLSRKECEKFWEIVEAEGAVSLGRKSGYDWMHFQFARF